MYEKGETVATKKRGLGRGLNALIGGAEEQEKEVKKAAPSSAEKKDAAGKADKPSSKAKPAAKKDAANELTAPEGNAVMVDIHLVAPDKNQPRETIDEESLNELTASIKEFGVLQPLLVAKKDGYYQIIAGERRFRAAMKAGLKEIPVMVKELAPEETLAVSLIENIQRDDLNPMEEAKAYQRLIKEFSLTQDAIAKKVGKSRPSIANSLRLLSLDPEIQAMMASGELSTGHAKVLLGVKDVEKQIALAKATVEKGWSVRQLEKAVILLDKEKAPAKEAVDRAVQLVLQETGRELQDILGTKVSIIQGKRKGMIEIEYYSEDELDRIISLMRSLR